MQPCRGSRHHRPPATKPKRSVRTEPGATAAKTDRQQRLNPYAAATTRLPSAVDGSSHSWPRPIGCRSTEKSRRINLSIFSNLRYKDRNFAGDAAAAACAELRARPEMTVTATGPLIQISAVFPGARVRPAALDRRRIGCSATPPGVEPQGGHATDQTSHGCMMKPIGAASSAGQQPKQRRVIPPQLCVNE